MIVVCKKINKLLWLQLLGLPEKDIKVLMNYCSMKGFGFEIAGDHTDIKGLMKNFTNYKNNFIEYNI